MTIGLRNPLQRTVILILLCMGCGSPVQLFQLPAMSDAPSRIEIPFGFDNGYPYITVLIDSTECEVYLDTGAAGVALALLPETIESLGLENTGGTRRLQTNYGTVSYRRSIIQSLNLGGLNYQNVLCDMQDPDIPMDHQQRGIIGLMLLRPFNVLIDYQNGKMVLFRQDSSGGIPDLSSWQQIPFWDDEDGLLVSASLPGADNTHILLLDTGVVAYRDQNSRFYNIMKPSSFSGFPDIEEFDGMPLVESREIISGEATLTGLNFISLDVPEPKSTDGFLGADFFMHYRVFIDFANSVLYVQPFE